MVYILYRRHSLQFRYKRIGGGLYSPHSIEFLPKLQSQFTRQGRSARQYSSAYGSPLGRVDQHTRVHYSCRVQNPAGAAISLAE